MPNQRKRWEPEEGMSRWQADRVAAGQMCGARRPNGAGYCMNRPEVPGPPREDGRARRCRYHGGRSTGAPKGNQYALKLGIYACALLPGEEDAADAVRVDSLEDEIAACKMRLRRAMRAEAELEAAIADGSLKGLWKRARFLRQVAITRKSERGQGGGGEMGEGDKGSPWATDRDGKETKLEWVLPDYSSRVTAIVSELTKLTAAQHALRTGESMTNDERARAARAALAEALRMTAPPPPEEKQPKAAKVRKP